MVRLFIFGLVVILFSGCNIGDNFYVGEPEDVRISGIQGNAVQIITRMPITNNNGFRVKVKEVNLEARIDGKYLGTVSNKEELIINGKTRDMYDVPLELEIKNIVLGATTMFKLTQQNKQKPKLSLEGEIVTTGIFIRKKIAIRQDDLLQYMN